MYRVGSVEARPFVFDLWHTRCRDSRCLVVGRCVMPLLLLVEEANFCRRKSGVHFKTGSRVDRERRIAIRQ